MEFTEHGKADMSEMVSEDSLAMSNPVVRGSLNKKSTICGECTVVEDIDQEPPVAPIDRLLVPGDIVEIKEDDDQLYIIGTKEGKVTKMTGIQHAKNMKVSSCSKSCSKRRV